MSRSEQRKDFEQWYACNAFDYARDPIGSRNCGLQWEAWQAAQNALIKKLAGVSVEPAYTTAKNGRLYTYPDEVDQTGLEIDVFTATQLAAARVQTINECAAACDTESLPYPNGMGSDGVLWEKGVDDCRNAIRALIGAQQ